MVVAHHCGHGLQIRAIALKNILLIRAIEFTQFKKDFETGSADFKKFIDESEDGMGVFSAYMMEVVPTFLKMQFILENLKS